MSKSDIEMAQAAYTVFNEIMDMRLALERAEIIMQDINEDYFNTYDNQSKDDKVSIAWEYPRNTVKSDIVSEYLYKMRVVLDSLYEQALQTGRERQEKKETVKA